MMVEADRYFVKKVFGGYEVDIPPHWVEVPGLRVYSVTLQIEDVAYDVDSQAVFVLFSGKIIGEGVGVSAPFPKGAEVAFSASVDGWLSTPRDPHRLGEWENFEFSISSLEWVEEE